MWVLSTNIARLSISHEYVWLLLESSPALQILHRPPEAFVVRSWRNDRERANGMFILIFKSV